MEARKGKRDLAMLASAVGGVSLGWLAVDYISKRQRREANESIIGRVKNFEKKLYADGEKRANEMQRIKQEVEEAVDE